MAGQKGLYPVAAADVPQPLTPGGGIASWAATPVQEAVPAAASLLRQVYGDLGEPVKPYADTKSRYLWTDAHGVFAYIALARETGDTSYLDRADALVADVHAVLGSTRGGVPLGPPHAPLANGLRIGKPHDAPQPDADGQYLHYITKWALALNRMALALGDAHYNQLAVQLLKGVHRRFVYQTPSGTLRSVWKMSVDLSAALVPSEGHLDAFDALAVYKLCGQHDATAAAALAAETRGAYFVAV